MDPTTTRPLGRTGLPLSQLGLGTATLGNLYAKLSDEDAHGTLAAWWDAGLRFVDTAPFYGYGLAEHRVGEFLRNQDPDAWVVSTKIGRLIRPHDPHDEWPGVFKGANRFKPVFDYTYDGVMRSYEDSLQRLGLHRVDVLLIHDIDAESIGSEEETERHRRDLFGGPKGGGFAALDELRKAGAIKAVGAGLNFWDVAERIAREADVDCFLLAGRYTLMEQEALNSFLPLCAERGIGIIVGGPYNSGILAAGPVEGATYNYAPAPPEIVERVGRIQAVCARHDVPMAAAALQFPLHHPAIASVIPGAKHADEVRRNVDTFQVAVPDALWAELKAEGLMRPDAPTP